jgi:hypothetical protein
LTSGNVVPHICKEKQNNYGNAGFDKWGYGEGLSQAGFRKHSFAFHVK